MGLFGSSGSLINSPKSGSTDATSNSRSSLDGISPTSTPVRGGKWMGMGRLRNAQVRTLTSVEMLQRALKKARANYGNASGLKAVIDAMFNLEDLLPERTQARLYEFLLLEKNLVRMLMLLTSDRIDVSSEMQGETARERHRHRYVACVFFLYGPPSGREFIVSDESLIRPLIDYVTSSNPVSVVGVDYVARVLSSLIHCAPATACKRMRSRPNFVSDLVKRISSSAVAQLIQRMLCERAYFDDEVMHFGPVNHDAVRLLSEAGLQELLADLLISEASSGVTVNDTVKVVNGAVDCMIQVSLRAVASLRFAASPTSRTSGNDFLIRQLNELDLLRNSDPLIRVIKASSKFQRWARVRILEALAYFVNTLMAARKSKIPEIRRVVYDAPLHGLLSKLVPIIKAFSVRLEEVEEGDVPIGPEKLEISRLCAAFLTHGSDDVVLELSDAGVHRRLLRLACSTRQSSMLHSCVVSLVQSCLNSNRDLLEDLCFKDGLLVRTIVETWNRRTRTITVGSGGSSNDDDHDSLSSTLIVLGQIVTDFIYENSERERPRDLVLLIGKDAFDAFATFRTQILGRSSGSNQSCLALCIRPKRNTQMEKDSDVVYDEDEPEALFLYNRLLERETGEDTEEGMARSVTAKRGR